jgi:hypothetical protein
MAAVAGKKKKEKTAGEPEEEEDDDYPDLDIRPERWVNLRVCRQAQSAWLHGATRLQR